MNDRYLLLTRQVVLNDLQQDENLDVRFTGEIDVHGFQVIEVSLNKYGLEKLLGSMDNLNDEDIEFFMGSSMLLAVDEDGYFSFERWSTSRLLMEYLLDTYGMVFSYEDGLVDPQEMGYVYGEVPNLTHEEMCGYDKYIHSLSMIDDYGFKGNEFLENMVSENEQYYKKCIEELHKWLKGGMEEKREIPANVYNCYNDVPECYM